MRRHHPTYGPAVLFETHRLAYLPTLAVPSGYRKQDQMLAQSISSAAAAQPERSTPYDKHFEYRSAFMDVAPRFFLRTQLMLQMLGSPRGALLDVGCGDGHFLRQLARRGFLGMGIDVSEVAISLAKSLLAGHPGCDVQCVPIEDFGPDQAYEVVTCGETLEHIEDDARFLREIYRLMKPSGTLVLSVPIDMTLWTEHDVRAGHFRRYDKAEIFQKLERAGFEVTDYRIWGYPLVRLMHLFIRRAQDNRMGSGAKPSKSGKRDILIKLKPLLRLAKYGILFDNLFNFTERGVGIVVKAIKSSESSAR